MSTNNFDLINSPLKGTNLIEASAGTGKTYIMAGLFLRLILEKGILVDKILAVTYTEAATEELRIRIRNRLKDSLQALQSGNVSDAKDELLKELLIKYAKSESALWRIKDALTRFDEASICTIHGFCHRMLAENAFESGSLFNAELVTDSNLTQEIVYDFWRKNFYSSSSVLAAYTYQKGINASYLLNLIKNFSIDPSFNVIPRPEMPDFSELEKRFLIAFKTLAKEWSHKSEIADILLTSKSLSRTKYSLKGLTNWISMMDGYLNSNNPVIIFEKFDKFTSSLINYSVNKGFEPPSHPFFDLCDKYLRTYNNLKTILDKFIISLEGEFFNYVKRESAMRKLQLNIMTFDDLLVNMHKSLNSGAQSNLAKTIREKYKAALIDEFQDTDPVQYDIFNNIFGTANSILFLIGDPKQSIYKFRGADIFAYIKASRDIKTRYTLGTNWRSTPEQLKAVNAIFKSKKYPFVFNEIKYNDINANGRNDDFIIDDKKNPFNIFVINKELHDMKGVISKGKAEAVIARSVAGEIFRLVESGKTGKAQIGSSALKPGHIAVLCRKNRQAMLVQNELQKYNIPGVLYGMESIFESHEAIEMERVIAAVSNPGDEKRLKTALATDMMGLSGNEIFSLYDDETAWEEYLNSFFEYHTIWSDSGFFRMFRSFTEKEGVRERLLSYTDGERRMTNLLHLAELLHRAETENKMGMESFVKWLKDKRILLENAEEHEIRLEIDEEAVKLITVHRSKGLEFPVVFCPFMWEGSAGDGRKPQRFHDPENNYNLTLDLACEENSKRIADTEELAENMRLLYVALTRSKYSTYLYWGRINKTETSALSYIFFNNDKDNSSGSVKELENNVKLMTYEAMMNGINAVADASDGAISVENISLYEYQRFNPAVSTDNELSCKMFSGNITNDWTVSSFSALTIGRKDYVENPDHDWIDNRILTQLNFDQITDQKTDKDYNIFTFPKGAIPGTCIHEIFEKLDFTFSKDEDAANIINESLIKYGIGSEWNDALLNMVKKVTRAPLPGKQDGLMLKNIPASDKLNELEFYMPLGSITAKGLSDIFFKSGIKSNQEFAGAMRNLGFKPHRGFIKGFIDMIFLYKDKYYIVDWKSNYLGNDISDYVADKLKESMKDNYYILQYYIYSAALHRFLSFRNADYDYEKHFGGIFYIFIRGTDTKYPSCGIFHDVPQVEDLRSFSSFLSRIPEEAAL